MSASASFLHLATVTAMILRPPQPGTNGKVGEPVLHIPALRCTPIDPIQPDVAQRLGLEAPYTGFQTFTTGDNLDVIAKDYLIANGRKYTVRAAGLWQWSATEEYIAMALENVKGSYGLE